MLTIAPGVARSWPQPPGWKCAPDASAIEAASCIGNAQVATDTLHRLAETTQADGTDFGLGLEARYRALVSQRQAAEGWYREAIDRLSRTRLRPELARAPLSTVNGCAATADAPTHASSWARPTTCSP
jgi:hypothetical protein